MEFTGIHSNHELHRSGRFRISLGCMLLTVAIVFPSRVSRAGEVATPRATECCTRIVSMAPNITELLYALDLGDRVIGVTPFCLYPLEATVKPKIGGFLDPNYEAILALKPDRIFGLSSHRDHRERLMKVGLDLTILPMNTIPEILSAITTVGSICGVEAPSARLRESIEARMAELRNAPKRAMPVRVMICIGRDYQTDVLDQVTIAGTDSFHDGIIELAGGINAYRGPPIEYPAVSFEGILAMDPDVIVELRPGETMTEADRERSLAAWLKPAGLRAAESHMITIWTDPHVSIPGPRFIEIAEALAAIVREVRDGKEIPRVHMP